MIIISTVIEPLEGRIAPTPPRSGAFTYA